MHVKVDCNAVGHFTSASVHQVLSQPWSQVALSCPTRPREDKTAVLKQQTDVVLHHRFWDERFKHQTIHTLFLQTWIHEGTVNTQQLFYFSKATCALMFHPRGPMSRLYKAGWTWLLWGHVTQIPAWAAIAFPALLACPSLHSSIPKHEGGHQAAKNIDFP